MADFNGGKKLKSLKPMGQSDAKTNTFDPFNAFPDKDGEVTQPEIQTSGGKTSLTDIFSKVSGAAKEAKVAKELESAKITSGDQDLSHYIDDMFNIQDAFLDRPYANMDRLRSAALESNRFVAEAMCAYVDEYGADAVKNAIDQHYYGMIGDNADKERSDMLGLIDGYTSMCKHVDKNAIPQAKMQYIDNFADRKTDELMNMVIEDAALYEGTGFIYNEQGSSALESDLDAATGVTSETGSVTSPDENGHVVTTHTTKTEHQMKMLQDNGIDQIGGSSPEPSVDIGPDND